VIFNGSRCLRSHLGNVRLLLCDSAAKGGRLIRGFIDGGATRDCIRKQREASVTIAWRALTATQFPAAVNT
jgi:hypothetical protein